MAGVYDTVNVYIKLYKQIELQLYESSIIVIYY